MTTLFRGLRMDLLIIDKNDLQRLRITRFPHRPDCVMAEFQKELLVLDRDGVKLHLFKPGMTRHDTPPQLCHKGMLTSWTRSPSLTGWKPSSGWWSL